MNTEREILETDVLIVGSGGAGIRAAIEAHKRGVKVTLIAKGKFPSGCTPFSMGIAQAAIDPKDSPDIHFKDTIVAGLYMGNQQLVRLMAEEALSRVQDLENFGTEVLKDAGMYKLFPSSGCTHARNIVTANAYSGGFIKGLVEEVKRLGIEHFENVMVTNLLTQNGAVVGATGLNLQTGDFLVFKAKSTILVTGGSGQLYSLTTNPLDVTGDGYAMAYRVGAELVDMEFIQFRASVIYPPALRGEPPPGDGLVTIGGRFYNVLGERYMKKYDPIKAENVTRDLVAIYALKEIKEGRGTPHGGIYNDLSGVSAEELNRFTKFITACKAEGIDPSWQPIEWAPGVHHFIGGLKINEKCETNIAGLYAAGEAVGGIHGANRLAGNALIETQVFGARAGRFAAENALSKAMPSIVEKQVVSERDRIFEIYERDVGKSVAELRSEIQKLMWTYVGVVRKGSELIEVINKLQEMRKNALPRIFIKGEKNYQKLGEALEVANFVDVAEMVAKAALMRTESRGAHYREDYSKRDDKNWLKNIVIKLEANEMKLVAVPSVMTELKPAL